MVSRQAGVSGSSDNVATPGPGLEASGKPVETGSTESGKPAVDGPSSSLQVSAVEGTEQTRRARTPMENYQPSDIDALNVAGKDAGKTAQLPGGSGRNEQVSASGPVSSSPSVSDSDTRESNRADTARPVNHSREPEPISYWELPDSVRADVPEITYTVLVYNTNPDERFVLINGVRLAEGDSYQPGLVVKEIRREGVIFSFRLYQFLVKR